MGLRRLARQMRAGRRKAQMALAWVRYVESEQRAGRVPMDKRTWRAKRPDLVNATASGE